MRHSSIAQLVEQSAVNRSVVGSSPTSSAMWLVGETVNSHAFHACIHGFESRTGHHKWRFSSVGRASALQAEGQRFEPVNLHHFFADLAQLVEQLTCNQ